MGGGRLGYLPEERGLYSTLEREQAATDAALAEHPDLSERLGKDGIAVRERHVHRIEEYARHCGHAGLVRECIDGREASDEARGELQESSAQDDSQ